MHVHIHRLGRNVQLKHAGRKLACHHRAAARLFQRRRSGLAFHIAAVDKKILHAAAGARGLRPTHKALHRDAAHAVRHRHQPGGKFAPVNCKHRRPELTVARCAQRFAAVAHKPHRHLRVRQRKFIEHICDCIALRHIFFEELHARGRVIEQIPHQHRGAAGAARILNERFVAAVDAIMRAGQLRLRAREQLHPRHGANGSQRFAAKAQRADGAQVGGGLNFAGCMAQKCLGHIGARNAAAVVRHTHIGGAAVVNFNGDHRCARVNGVFGQLLDHRCGALHHLACGDQFGNVFFEHMNFWHPGSSFRRD